MVVLELKNVSIEFGGLKAVQNINLEVHKGQICGLIGPNGAGKTTTFNVLTGVYQPTKGEILLSGHNIVGENPIQINHRGIARTFQNIRLFKDLSVIDNVKVAMNRQMSYSVFSGIFHTLSYWKEEKKINDAAYEYLDILGLTDYAHQFAKNLPYGQQRKLEIARALATRPRALLLDEPAAGMNPTETMDLMETIRDIRKKYGLSILLIEHDMAFVMQICEHIYVLDYGKVIACGSPDEIKNDKKVIEAYLGGE